VRPSPLSAQGESVVCARNWAKAIVRNGEAARLSLRVHPPAVRVTIRESDEGEPPTSVGPECRKMMEPLAKRLGLDYTHEVVFPGSSLPQIALQLVFCGADLLSGLRYPDSMPTADAGVAKRTARSTGQAVRLPSRVACVRPHREEHAELRPHKAARRRPERPKSR
jgi:hypothetical protein